MTALFGSLFALLLSVAVLLTGHGLQQTITPLFADSLGWSTEMIGYVGSAYFFGFVVGCITIPRIVTWVGHIRVFAVLVSAATAALLSLSLTENLVFWVVARFVTGCAMSGGYMVIESWLNERTSPGNRGLILSIYAALSLAAMCVGQLLLGFGTSYQTLVVIGAVLLTLAIIPIGLTRSQAPAPIPTVGFQFARVWRTSHIGVSGALVGGFVTSGFWAIGPIVAKAQSLNVEQIGIFMAVTLLGGATLQLPVGRLSDHIDRRLVIAGLAVATCIVSFSAIAFAGTAPQLLYVFMFLFGGTIFPLYSISLAHANDNTDLPLIGVGSVILMANGAGSVAGPIIIAAVMAYSGEGLFWVTGVATSVFAGWTLVRVRRHEAKREFFEPFADVPKTSLNIIEANVNVDAPHDASPSGGR